MSTSDNYVLIGTTKTYAVSGETKIETIQQRVIRTYLSSQRAHEDLDLLHELCDGQTFEIIQIEHIDD